MEEKPWEPVGVLAEGSSVLCRHDHCVVLFCPRRRRGRVLPAPGAGTGSTSSRRMWCPCSKNPREKFPG